METIHLKITLIASEEPEKPKGALYKMGYGLAQILKSAKDHKEAKSHQADLGKLMKDWNKDYSDLDTPAVIRKERTSKDA